MISVGAEATCLAVAGVGRCWYQPTVKAKDQSSFAFDSDVVEIRASESHYCALLEDHSLRCWQDNISAENAREFPAAVDDFVVSFETGCALTAEEHEVRCWGTSDLLGPGVSNIVSIEDAFDIDPIPIPAEVAAISGSESHVCAIDVSGKIWCWGLGGSGQLGYGSTASRGKALADFQSPVPLGVLAVDASVGDNWSCALMPSGAVRCWGGLQSHGNGRIYGDNEPASVGGSVQLGGTVARLALSSGTSHHMCVVMESGAVRCWGAAGPLGYENLGAVGDDEVPASVGVVNVGENVVFVAVGGQPFAPATCAIGVSGKVYCWGDSQYAGYLGYGDGNDRGGTPGSMPPGPVPFE